MTTIYNVIEYVLDNLINPKLNEHTPAVLCSNKNYVLKAVEKCDLIYADAKLRADRDFILCAVKQDGCALRYASAELRADREIVLYVVKQNGLALNYADAELRADREIAVCCLKQG